MPQCLAWLVPAFFTSLIGQLAGGGVLTSDWCIGEICLMWLKQGDLSLDWDRNIVVCFRKEVFELLEVCPPAA